MYSLVAVPALRVAVDQLAFGANGRRDDDLVGGSSLALGR